LTRRPFPNRRARRFSDFPLIVLMAAAFRRKGKCREVEDYRAMAIGGSGWFMGWNRCPKPEPAVHYKRRAEPEAGDAPHRHRQPKPRTGIVT
jgi:hypothetical protein